MYRLRFVCQFFVCQFCFVCQLFCLSPSFVSDVSDGCFPPQSFPPLFCYPPTGLRQGPMADFCGIFFVCLCVCVYPQSFNSFSKRRLVTSMPKQ